MPTTKRHGKTDVFLWRKDGAGAAVDLSGSSRTVSYTAEGSKQDTSTRDDMVANATSSFANPPERSIELSGLDTTPVASRTWDEIEVGDRGTWAHYPLGTSTGASNPFKLGTGDVNNSSYESPHDGPAEWTVGWDVVGPVTRGNIA